MVKTIMDLPKSIKGLELSPGAKRLISTHVKQKPQLSLDKFAFKPKETCQFSLKNTQNQKSHTAPQKRRSRSSNRINQEEKEIPGNVWIKKEILQEHIKEDNVSLPISSQLQFDNQNKTPEEECQVNDTNKLNSNQQVNNDGEKIPDNTLSDKVECKKENNDQLLENLHISEEKYISLCENDQKDIRIIELSKEIDTMGSAWLDDKKCFQRKIRELEEKLKGKDEEICVLQSQINQHVGTVNAEIVILQPHTNQCSENPPNEKKDSLISDNSNILNFDLGTLHNDVDKESQKSKPLKRKSFEEKNIEMNRTPKKQNLLKSSKAHYQAAKDLTPPLTPTHKSIQNFVSIQNDNFDPSLNTNSQNQEKSLEDNRRKSAVKLSSIVFDLETNGLKRNYHSIIQISDMDVSDTSSSMFNAYICPNNEFDPKASAVNGFYMKNGDLYKNEKKMSTVTENKAISSFLDWLKIRKSKCILIAHNGKRFDVPRLLDLIKKHNLFNDFKHLVHGFVDTLKLFKSLYPKMGKYTQTHLVKEILDLEYDAHDGIDDVIALAKLVSYNTISVESIITNIDQTPLGIIAEDKKRKKTLYENEITLKPLYVPLITSEDISLRLSPMDTPEKENKCQRKLSEDVVIDTNENVDTQSKMIENCNEEHVMVAFDLETTGLDRYNHEIVQISAVEVNNLSEKFNIYILPKCEFEPKASEINGLHILNGRLCKKYYKLDTVCATEGINAFVTWLSNRKKKCLLFAHNGKYFDMPRIMDSCKNGDVFELFKKYVIGYVDTLHLFRYLHPKRFPYTQAALVKDFLHLTYNAHDGLEDATALAKLLKHKSVTNESIFSHINSI